MRSKRKKQCNWILKLIYNNEFAKARRQLNSKKLTKSDKFELKYYLDLREEIFYYPICTSSVKSYGLESCTDYENPDTAAYYRLRLTVGIDNNFSQVAELVDATWYGNTEGDGVCPISSK